MTEPPAPFIVDFSDLQPTWKHDQAVIHRSNASVVGETRVQIRQEFELNWHQEPLPERNLLLAYVESVEIHFYMPRFEVSISTTLEANSCAYHALQRHEQRHVDAAQEAFRAGRDQLIDALMSLAVPTESNPLRLQRRELRTTAQDIQRQISRVVQHVKDAMMQAIAAANAALDTPESYAAMHAECAPTEWPSGRR